MMNIDTSHYTNKMWFDEISYYLINVIGMNTNQVREEFIKRGWSELLQMEIEE